MSGEIDVRVTPSLHPTNVQKIDGYGDDTKHLLAATETAFSEAYIGIGQVHDARAAAARNPTWNEAGQLIQTHNLGERVFTRIAKHFDAALGNLNRGIASIEAELSAPIASSAALRVATEIRAHVKGLKATERMAFVQQAIRDSDQRTATAILANPTMREGYWKIHIFQYSGGDGVPKTTVPVSPLALK